MLDVLGLPRAGFGGASVFRRLSGGRTLLAADADKTAIDAVSEQSVVCCDQALTCFDTDGAAIDAAGIRAVLARNELRRVDDSRLLGTMPARDYAAGQTNLLLGGYLTDLPRGQGMVLRVSADHGDGAARLFRNNRGQVLFRASMLSRPSVGSNGRGDHDADTADLLRDSASGV